VFLPLYVRKIKSIMLDRLIEKIAGIGYKRGNFKISFKKFDGFIHRSYPYDVQVVYDGGFFGIFLWQYKTLKAFFSGFDSYRKHALNRSKHPIEGEFAHNNIIF